MPAAPSSDELAAAAAALHAGAVVLHATEGVWGFACDPSDESAVERILRIKGRDVSQGLLLIAASAAEFRDELGQHSPALRSAAQASWPGPHTWVLPNVRYGAWITGARDTVGCRVPGHDQARALCAAFGGPLVSTSANRSGEPPAVNYAQAAAAFADCVDVVLCGEVVTPGAASIIHGMDGAILRGG